MDQTAQPGFDPVALFVLVIVLAVGAAFGIPALRRRRETRRATRPSGPGTRLDVIRRDVYRLAEYKGDPSGWEPAVSEPFGLGRAAMAECQWSRAIEHFQEARAGASRAQLVPLLVQIGVCRYMQGNLVDALEEFGQSSCLADKEGDKQGRAFALANSGVVRQEFGQLDGAIKHLHEALELARESDDQRLVALCLGNIGIVQRCKGRLDDALKSHEHALDMSRRIWDEPGVVSALGNSASVSRDKAELDRALAGYEEAAETACGTAYKLGYAIELGGLGGVHFDKGELDRALKFHKESLDAARRIGFRLGEATELGNIGLVLEKQGAQAEAVPNLAEALTILLSTGVRHGRNQTLLGLSRCDDALGRERMRELLRQAQISDEGATDLLERIDQIRRRLPAPKAPDGPSGSPEPADGNTTAQTGSGKSAGCRPGEDSRLPTAAPKDGAQR